MVLSGNLLDNPLLLEACWRRFLRSIASPVTFLAHAMNSIFAGEEDASSSPMRMWCTALLLSRPTSLTTPSLQPAATNCPVRGTVTCCVQYSTGVEQDKRINIPSPFHLTPPSTFFPLSPTRETSCPGSPARHTCRTVFPDPPTALAALSFVPAVAVKSMAGLRAIRSLWSFSCPELLHVVIGEGREVVWSRRR